MSFFSLVLKNIRRHKGRTILTVLGISLGVATIVVFALIANSMEDSITEAIQQGDTDFIVLEEGTSDLVLSFLEEDGVQRMMDVEGVAQIIPYTLGVANVDNNPFFITEGVEPQNLEALGIDIVEGEEYASGDEIIILESVAQDIEVEVGDTININEVEYNVVGIFSQMQMAGGGTSAMTTLEQVQEVHGSPEGVNGVAVVVEEGFDVREVANAVEDLDDNYSAVVEARDHEAISNVLDIVSTIANSISLLAIIIGAIGVMNTIIMSVFERTREIGVLRAIGWSKRRIKAMILLESSVIGFFAGIVGIVIGVFVVFLVGNTDFGADWLAPTFDLTIFVQALLVAELVVLLGALYPSIKASRLQPTEALRYE